MKNLILRENEFEINPLEEAILGGACSAEFSEGCLIVEQKP